MSERWNGEFVSRRRMLAGGVIAMAGVASTQALGVAFGQAPAAIPAMPAKADAEAEKKLTSLHQENEFKATPERIYELLLDAKLFTAFSGEPAEIRPEAGAAFSLFGARVLGRNIELAPGERIVQVWKPAYWKPGIYSLVKFELKARGAMTSVVLDHWGFVEGSYGSFTTGWKEHYWDRIEKYLG